MASKRTHHELTAVCEYCQSAGILVDPEDAAIGIVCAGCGGCGHCRVSFEAFVSRRRVEGVRHIRRSGAAPPFRSKKRKIALVSYAEFLKGKLP